MIKTMIDIIKNGLWKENCIFSLALGLCPALAVTSNAYNGFGMGCALIFVLAFSVLICSIVRNYISPRVRIPVFLAVIACFVTITDLTLKAYFPPLAESLGIFVPLIVVNCIVLGRVEVFASKNPPYKAFADGIGMGAGYMFFLIGIGGIREILGDGKFFGIPILEAFHYKPALIMILPPGGFMTIGILMGIYSWYNKKQTRSEIARAKGVSREEILHEEPPDEITYADLLDRKY